jgi:hypothetical protein
MSFVNLYTENIDVTTINHLPYVVAGTIPYFHTSIGIMNFGFSSDATACFTQGVSSSPFYWQPAPLPAPSSDHSYTPDGSENYGTVAVSVPSGNYSLSTTMLAAPAGAILQITINGVSTNIDTYTADTNNENLQIYVPFTVVGTGYQTVLINFQCNGANVDSSGFKIYPSSTGIDIDSIYTGGPFLMSFIPSIAIEKKVIIPINKKLSKVVKTSK